jgi:putative transposase
MTTGRSSWHCSRDQRITRIVVEHKDRATRFGFRYVEVLLRGQGRTLEVVNLADNDQAAFASKNLYNQASYQIRQAFIHEGKYLPYAAIFHRIKHMDCYQALPRKVSNSILILIHQNWVAFFKANEAYKADPSKFLGRPKIPGYKDKEKGRNILIYDKQALGKRAFKKTGKLVPSGVPLEISTKVIWEQLDQVRIVPRGSGYVVEVVYTLKERQAAVDPRLIAALDLGVDQLAALTSNKPGFVPRLINGRPLKDFNHYYNQQRAHHQERLAKQSRRTSHRLDGITAKRTRRVNQYLHTASRRIIDLLVEERIGTLVIGLNRQWKQEVELGRRNNQTFVQIPHSRFIDMLMYKARLVGIHVIVREESYTLSKEFPNAFHAFSDSQTRSGQEIGAQQLRLAA